MESLGNDTTELTILIPTDGERGTTISLRKDCWQKISEHNHEGSGTGIKIKGYAGLDHTEATIPNNTNLNWRNNAGTGNKLSLKVSLSDTTTIGNTISTMTIEEATTDALKLGSTSNSGHPSGNDLVDVATYAHVRVTTLQGSTFVMADGVPGQIKILNYTDTGGTATVTPVTFSAGTSFAMNNVDTIILIWSDTYGWYILGPVSFGTMSPPVT